MRVLIYDCLGREWTYHNATVKLIGDILTVHVTRDGKKTLYNFMLRNVVCYTCEKEEGGEESVHAGVDIPAGGSDHN